MPTLMDGTYFVGRNELLQWINSTLGLNLQKIEQTSNGAVACQLLDVLRPGQVQLSKVDFNAKSEYEMIGNYKVLQATFSKLGVDKHIEVAKLMKGKPLDNMEFMQWLKAYFDGQTGGQAPEGYDAKTRRASSRTGDVRTAGTGGRARPRQASFNTNINGARSGGGGGQGPPAARPATGRSTLPPAASPARQAAPSAPHVPDEAADTMSAPEQQQPQQQQPGADPAEVQALTDQVASLEVTADTAAKERDFYFGKLRDIEILCQTPGLQSDKVVQTVERVLYASNDEESKRVIAEAQANLRAGRQIDGSAVNGDGQSPPREAAANGQIGAPY